MVLEMGLPGLVQTRAPESLSQRYIDQQMLTGGTLQSCLFQNLNHKKDHVPRDRAQGTLWRQWPVPGTCKNGASFSYVLYHCLCDCHVSCSRKLKRHREPQNPKPRSCDTAMGGHSVGKRTQRVVPTSAGVTSLP